MLKTITILEKTLCFLLSSAMLFSCASDLEDSVAQEGCEIVVSARCVDTRSTLSSDLGVVWNADDRVTVLSVNGSVSAVSEPGGGRVR